MTIEIPLLIIQIIGIVSFAASGTLIAIDKRTDIIGALVFSMLTCFGGGMLRDFTLGINPPSFLSNLEYFLLEIITLAVTVLLFSAAFSEKFMKVIVKHKNDFWLDLTDAIGLGIFCVFGVDIAIEQGFGTNYPLLIFCGCITSVGGGVLRDICSATIPRLFRKHIYLLPVIFGTMFYTFTRDLIGQYISILVTVLSVVIIRMLARHFHWNLPTPLGRIREHNSENH